MFFFIFVCHSQIIYSLSHIYCSHKDYWSRKSAADYHWKGWDPINWLKPAKLSAGPKSGLAFSMPYICMSWSFLCLMSWGETSVVCIVDIGGIVDQFKLSFHKMFINLVTIVQYSKLKFNSYIQSCSILTTKIVSTLEN